MPSPELNQKRRDLNKAYRALFGYSPSPSNYACSTCEFFDALAKAVEEKKDISCYLSKRAAHIDGTLE